MEIERYWETGRTKIIAARQAFLDGKPMYQNYGLGSMSERMRGLLKASGKITTEDGVDVVALAPLGIIEYEERGKEEKRLVIRGTENQIRLKLDAAKSQINQSKGTVTHEEIGFYPAWDGESL